jgi:diaminopimelate decarboxylase
METIDALRGVLPEDSSCSPGGHLVVGGCDATELAERFGTPLVVLDRATFEARAAAFSTVLEHSRVFYAGKAFLCIAVCELLAALGLGLDVCTGGELVTALRAGFPADRIIFHGNNKSPQELGLAASAGVGRVVVDSFEEIERIQRAGLETALLVRVAPGVEAATHDFVRTGQEDSKFGFTLDGGVALDAVRKALAAPGCKLVGLHAHIGSQILELAAFELAIRRLAQLARSCRDETGFVARELNLGGGLGIAHTAEETAPEPAEWVKRMIEATDREFSGRRLEVPALAVEPGRAIVGPAGATLYRVGTVKRIPGVRTYVSVDGGMSDNIRPALYGARYEAFLANRMSSPPGPPVTVAGKHCESGDLLVADVHLPADVAPGDLLAIPATGAYTHSMASSYNRVPRPPVVMVDRGRATEIVAREPLEDVYRLDRHLRGAPPA